eukprot:TRINITY_DN261_c0_g1_i18.p1 TRINITY_DN261_c0_g1~~TRINITY_DN261_c0_g1_i18.p1  ORF type:complete len:351 (-),score=104.38 TRINITY_DN261_c0_g1_i18:231-1283(-)
MIRNLGKLNFGRNFSAIVEKKNNKGIFKFCLGIGLPFAGAIGYIRSNDEFFVDVQQKAPQLCSLLVKSKLVESKNRIPQFPINRNYLFQRVFEKIQTDESCTHNDIKSIAKMFGKTHNPENDASLSALEAISCIDEFTNDVPDYKIFYRFKKQFDVVAMAAEVQEATEELMRQLILCHSKDSEDIDLSPVPRFFAKRALKKIGRTDAQGLSARAVLDKSGNDFVSRSDLIEVMAKLTEDVPVSESLEQIKRQIPKGQQKSSSVMSWFRGPTEEEKRQKDFLASKHNAEKNMKESNIKLINAYLVAIANAEETLNKLRERKADSDVKTRIKNCEKDIAEWKAQIQQLQPKV